MANTQEDLDGAFASLDIDSTEESCASERQTRFKEASDLISHLCEEFEIDSELEREMQSLLSTCSNTLFYSNNAIGIFVLKCHLKRSKQITAVQVASFLRRINFRNKAMTSQQIHTAIQHAKKELSSEEIEQLDMDNKYLNLGGESDEVKFEDPDLFDKTQLENESNPPKVYTEAEILRLDSSEINSDDDDENDVFFVGLDTETFKENMFLDKK